MDHQTIKNTPLLLVGIGSVGTTISMYMGFTAWTQLLPLLGFVGWIWYIYEYFTK